MIFAMTMKVFKRAKNEVKGGPNAKLEEGLLFIDCRPCTSPFSLGDERCVRCVSNIIEMNGPPSRLMVRKETDTEYSESTIATLAEISKIGSLAKAASSENVQNKCKECRASLPRNAKDIWDSFPEPRFDIMRSEAERSVQSGEGCEECLWRTIGFIDRLETMFSDLRRDAAKKAFRLTEV
jgi:hypothetical protein